MTDDDSIITTLLGEPVERPESFRACVRFPGAYGHALIEVRSEEFGHLAAGFRGLGQALTVTTFRTMAYLFASTGHPKRARNMERATRQYLRRNLPKQPAPWKLPHGQRRRRA